MFLFFFDVFSWVCRMRQTGAEIIVSARSVFDGSLFCHIRLGARRHDTLRYVTLRTCRVLSIAFTSRTHLYNVQTTTVVVLFILCYYYVCIYDISGRNLLYGKRVARYVYIYIHIYIIWRGQRWSGRIVGKPNYSLFPLPYSGFIRLVLKFPCVCARNAFVCGILYLPTAVHTFGTRGPRDGGGACRAPIIYYPVGN